MCFTPARELGFALHEMESITGLPTLGDLYEDYTPFEEELKQLKVRDKEFHCLLLAPFDLHIRLAYENRGKDGLPQILAESPSSSCFMGVFRASGFSTALLFVSYGSFLFYIP